MYTTIVLEHDEDQEDELLAMLPDGFLIVPAGVGALEKIAQLEERIAELEDIAYACGARD